MVIISPNGHYPLLSNCIPEKFEKKAEDELMETKDNRINSLEQLRELVQSDKDVKCRITDEFLLQFLRARKFNVPRAFNLVRKYWNFKRKNIKIFTEMDYEVLSKLVKDEAFGILPDRCADGCTVITVHLSSWEPSEISIDNICKAIVLFLYHSITDPLSQINGYKILFDVKSPGLKHVRYATPYYIYLLYTGTQECFPGRFKGIHVINMSLAFKTAWTIVKPFLSEKLKSRIIFHKEFKTLQEYFPEKMLPVSFGGELKSNDTITWLTHAMQPENLDKLAN